MFGREKKAAKEFADSVMKATKKRESKKFRQALLELFQDRSLK